MTPLAGLFSFIDSTKRKVGDAVSNPLLALQNFVNDKNIAAGQHLQDLRDAPAPGEWQSVMHPGPQALERVVQSLSEGYNPGGIFAGVASKTMDPKALMEASRMARMNQPMRDIWEETGWAKAPWDKQWRYEIDDSAAGPLLRSNFADPSTGFRTSRPLLPGISHVTVGGPFGKASENFQHPALFKAYPTLDSMTLTGQVKPEMPGEFSGYFARAVKGHADQIGATGKTPAYLREALVHELQHAVQKRQSWEGGGSPAQFLPQAFQQNKPGFYPIVPPDIMEKAMKQYERIPGEAESRLSQYRRNLSAEERRYTFPFDPEYFLEATGVPLRELAPGTAAQYLRR